MGRKTAAPLAPKLRFPEFAGAPGWELKALGKVLKPIVREREKPATVYTGLGLRSHGRGTFLKKDQQPDKISMDRLYEVAENDLIVNITFAWEGAISIAGPQDAGALVSHRFPTYELEKVEPGFLKHPILSKRFIYDLGVISPGGAGRNRVMNKTDFLKLRVPIPKTNEQRKIAECLGSLDELIAAESRKLDALRQHKKGLMQRLFPQPGETVPRIRFPEFKDAGEWDVKTIGEIGSFYYGKSAPKWSLSDDAPTHCVRYGELYSTFGPVISETYSRTNIEPENLRFSKGGEILVPRVGEKPEEFGRCCSFLPLRDIAIGEMISVFETKQDPLFYTYYFRNLYREFARVVEGQNVKNLYYANLEPIPILKPSRPEQEKIAAYLWSLDQLIEPLATSMETLKIHKRGLLQQLIPLLKGNER